MVKYRLTRDYSANGTTENNAKAPVGQLAPKNIYLTKKLKKGDIIEGEIASENSIFGTEGKSIAFKTMGATTTDGKPYSNLALLYIPIDNAGALEEINDKENLPLPAKKSMTIMHIGLFVGGLAVGYFAYKKFKK
jgi:hypothetical protein